MKKTFTIILSILLLASCINNDYKETQKLISEANNFDIKTLSKITSKISDSEYSKDEALEIRNLYVQYLNDIGSQISDSINTLIFSTDIDNYKIEEITERKRLELQKYGIVLYNIEGELSYYILPYYVTSLFIDYLSPCEIELSIVQQKEIEDPVIIDAGIVVPCSEIANRLHNTEMILQECTDSTCFQELHEFQQMYLMLLIFGIDNTPAFDWNTHEMDMDFKNEIINYINEYPELPSSKIFSEYIEILKKTNFKESKESRKFIEKLTKTFY